MYAKLENGQIKFPPKHLKEAGRYIANYNHHDEALKEDGWLEVVESEPEQREGYYPICKYRQDGDKIIQEWDYVEDTEEEDL